MYLIGILGWAQAKKSLATSVRTGVRVLDFVVGRPSCLPSCLLGWCWSVQLWRTRGGQTSASPSLACRRPRADYSKLPSNESKRGVNPTHTEPQPDTAGGKHHRGETAQGGNSTRGNPSANRFGVGSAGRCGGRDGELQMYLIGDILILGSGTRRAQHLWHRYRTGVYVLDLVFVPSVIDLA